MDTKLHALNTADMPAPAAAGAFAAGAPSLVVWFLVGNGGMDYEDYYLGII